MKWRGIDTNPLNCYRLIIKQILPVTVFEIEFNIVESAQFLIAIANILKAYWNYIGRHNSDFHVIFF